MAALPLGQTGAVRQAAAPGEAPLAEGCNEPFAVGTNLVEGLMRRPPPAGLLCVVCLFGLLDARPAGAQANPDFDAVTWTPLTCDAALLTALDPGRRSTWSATPSSRRPTSVGTPPTSTSAIAWS